MEKYYQIHIIYKADSSIDEKDVMRRIVNKVSVDIDEEITHEDSRCHEIYDEPEKIPVPEPTESFNPTSLVEPVKTEFDESKTNNDEVSVDLRKVDYRSLVG